VGGSAEVLGLEVLGLEFLLFWKDISISGGGSQTLVLFYLLLGHVVW
jgi:hypothetical protein